MSALPKPRRGEIWFAHLPSDPAGKGPRPVVIVSVNERNLNDRAETILAVPLTTTIRESAFRIAISPGETGLRETSMLIADGITVLRKQDLLPPRTPLRQLSEHRIRECAVGVVRGMGFTTEIIHVR